MEKKIRYVNIIGSSLTLPRSWANQYYEDTWAFELFKYLNQHTSDLWQVINNSKYGLLVGKDFNKPGINKTILNYPSEILIMGFGGSDRQPEVIPPKIKRLTRIMPKILKNKIFEYYNVNRYKFLQKRAFYEISFDEYEKGLRTVLEYTKDQYRIYLSLPQMPNFTKTIPGLKSQFQLLNDCSRKIVESCDNLDYIDIWDESSDESIYLDDGAHLNNKGHKIIFEKIKEKVMIYLENKG